MKKLDFVFFDAGGGHRSAATALKAVSEEQRRPWDISLMNLQDVLDSLDIFRKLMLVFSVAAGDQLIMHGVGPPLPALVFLFDLPPTKGACPLLLPVESHIPAD